MIFLRRLFLHLVMFALQYIHVLTSRIILFSTDGGQLLQPLANQAQSANARSKPDLVIKVAGKITLHSAISRLCD